MLLSDAELNDMRQFVEDGFPDTCTIQTRSDVNTKGSVASSYANTYLLVPCRVMPYERQGREYEAGAGVKGAGVFVLTVPYDQAIAITNRVIHQGVTYEVTAVFDTHNYRTARRAEMTVVR
jgi:hypothetical protein